MLRFGREQVKAARYAEHRHWENEAVSARDCAEIEYLEECLAQLPPALRQLVEMQYREGRSGEEIATACQHTLTWVRVTLFRVRQQLRACIEGKLERRHA